MGKTTAALNLGYLLKKKYHVLVLDIDITGTSIKAIQESRFWMKDTHLLAYSNGSPVNLLQYYAGAYLKGEQLFEFSHVQEDNKILVREGFINVIASELYGEDASLLYNPSLLLDNLHVYWLTRLITSICSNFANCFDDAKPSIIILDNSPGFVGIGKTVHDILTDLGPENAKFLTVSSLDIQDLESSLKSIYALHLEYLDKLRGSKFPDTQQGDESFYVQMQLSGDTEYLYYRENNQEATYNFYQGLIINKVSRGIIEGKTRYEFKRNMIPMIQNVFDLLFEDGIKNYLIPFDNVLMTQFYGLFDDKKYRETTSHTILKKRLNTIEGQIKMLDELGPDLLPYDMLRRAEGFDKTIDTLKGALIASGYEIIASKFNLDWSPVSPLREMIEVLKGMDYAPDSFELYVPRRTRMRQEMEHFREIASHAVFFAEKQQQDFVWLASAVASVACELSFCFSNKIIWNSQQPCSNTDSWDDNKEKWAERVNDSMYNWMIAISNSYSIFDGGKTSLAAYVISNQTMEYDKSIAELFPNESFVISVKKAVSRLVDLSSDMQTLINLIRTITINNNGSYSLDVDFVSFLNHKIVDKTYDYNEAKTRMNGELRDSDYMASYREVLKRIINQWSL